MSIVVPLLLAALTFLLYRSWRSSTSVQLPPGPTRLPVIGSLHRVPFGYQQHAFFAWKKTYGDIVYLQLFHKPAVVLNSAKVIEDLLDKRGSKYSDRPTSVLIADLIGFTNNITILPYGDQWRRQRRWFQNGFQSAAALKQYEPLQRRESVRMLIGMLDLCQTSAHLSPKEMGEKVFSGIKRYVGAMMMEIAYGHSVASLDDEFVVLSERAIGGTVALGTSVASLVDFFPALRRVPAWVPGMGFMRRVTEVRELVRAMIDVPYERVRASLTKGTARPCFLTALLDEHAKDGQMSAADEADVKGAANIVYGAGTDTTATVLTSFLLAVVLYPDCLRKAQAELDRVVGGERLPDFDDRSSLVYCEALLKEVYRWNPPVPLVIPHRVSEDDVYEGYTIPGDSVIMPNLWAMARDSECYKDPWLFSPERFLGNAPERDPREFAFGFGRRSCPGRAFGDASVWLAAMRILAVFDLTKARDPSTGAVVEFEPQFASGMISHVGVFPMSVRLRSERAAKMVRGLVDAEGSGGDA